MIDFVANNFHSIAGAILVAALGGYVVWRNGYKARTAQAAARFRSIFLAELVGLYPEATDWPRDIGPRLAASRANLNIAVTEFQRFVPFWRRRAFLRAWKTYCSHSEKDILEQCSPANILYGGATPLKAKGLLQTDINELFAFATQV